MFVGSPSGGGDARDQRGSGLGFPGRFGGDSVRGEVGDDPQFGFRASSTVRHSKFLVVGAT